MDCQNMFVSVLPVWTMGYLVVASMPSAWHILQANSVETGATTVNLAKIVLGLLESLTTISAF